MDQIPTPVWEDQKLNQYFKTLPVFVQETIAQTGIQITDEAQLRAVAEKILKGSSSKMSLFYRVWKNKKRPERHFSLRSFGKGPNYMLSGTIILSISKILRIVSRTQMQR